MTLSRYRGARRAPATLRVVAVSLDVDDSVAQAEDSDGSGAGGGLPSGRTSRYSGAARVAAPLRMLSLFEAPVEAAEEAVEVIDDFPIIFA